jgi:hypothetical protein
MAVEELYHNDRPLYHRPQARQVFFDQSDIHHSAFFIVDYQDFRKMSAKEIQSVFKNRHILIENAPLPTTSFESGTVLEDLGDLDKVIDIQGILFIMVPYLFLIKFLDISLRIVDNPGVCLRQGTLQEFYQEAQKQGDRRILNCLDIEMGMSQGSSTPEHRYLIIPFQSILTVIDIII